jgi:hypothetical protein
MGLLIPNHLRRQSATINGRTSNFLTRSAFLQDVTVLSVKAGRPEGSSLDGSPYATINTQVKPGTTVRLIAYGEESKKALDMKPGDKFEAFANPIQTTRQGSPIGKGYKVDEIIAVHPVSIPAPEAPAAEPANV